MSQSRQQQQQQQQHSNSDSNFNVAQPQSEPCREDLEALSETDIDTWLATLPGPEECDISFAVELQILLATQPDNTDTQQQATIMSSPALPCPEECHTLLAEDKATQPDANTNTQPTVLNPADLVYVTDTQQPSTGSTPSRPGPQQCHASLPEDLHTTTDTQQEATTATVRTRLQDKALENALVTCPEGIENRWDRIAALVPGGKTPAEVSKRYEQLLHDISLIQSGWVELPIYKDDLTEAMEAATKVDGGTTKHTAPVKGNGKKCRWTEEEHK